MKIECIRNISATTGEELESGEGGLTIGKIYIVLSIRTIPERKAEFLLVSDDGGPALFDSVQFRTVSGEIPSNWVATVDEKGVVGLGPEKWTRPGFWEDYFDGVPEAVAEFEAEKEKVFAETRVPASKPGDRIVLDPFVTQPNNIFTSATYQEFLEQWTQNLQEYFQLYDRHLQYKTPRERFESPERKQIDLLKKQFHSLRQEYFQRLPIHLLAQCPYCGSRILQPVDTFSLTGFHPMLNIAELYHGREWRTAKRPPRQRCEHALLAMVSVNLNGLMPNDSPEWALQRRWMPMDSAPYVMVWPLIARQTSAVVHALPIGRLDDAEPIHRYTAYFVTYFVSDKSNLYTKEMWVPTDLGEPAVGAVQIDTDLVKWVKAGRLYWLDPEDTSRLMRGPAKAFPYGNVQPQGWYEIEGGQVDGPRSYHLLWRGEAPPHGESYPKTIE